MQAATFCTISSPLQLSDFSLSPEPSSPPVTGRPAGWSKTCTNFPLAQNLFAPPPPAGRTRTRTRTGAVLLHILYNISRSTARSTTISYTSQSNTLATDFCSKYYLSLSLEIIPAPSHFLLTVLKCLRPPSGAAPMLSLWSKLIRTLTLSLLRSLIELQTIKMPGHSVKISV